MSIPSCGREMSNIMRQFVDVLFCHRLSTILFSKKFTSFCTVHTTNLCLNTTKTKCFLFKVICHFEVTHNILCTSEFLNAHI